MAVQNPIMDAIRSDRSVLAMGAAARTASLAQQSFQSGASMALKMDQLLQQEEDRLYNRSVQSQKMLQDTLMNSMNMQFKRDEAARLQSNADRSFKEGVRQFGVNEDIARTKLSDQMDTNALSRAVNQVKLTEAQRIAANRAAAIKQIQETSDSFLPDRKDYYTGTSYDRDEMARSGPSNKVKVTKEFDNSGYARDAYLAMGKMNALYKRAGLGEPYTAQMKLLEKDMDNTYEVKKTLLEHGLKEQDAVNKFQRELPGKIADMASDIQKEINPATGLTYSAEDAQTLAIQRYNSLYGNVNGSTGSTGNSASTSTNTGTNAPATLYGPTAAKAAAVNLTQVRALQNNSEHAQDVWTSTVNSLRDPTEIMNKGTQNKVVGALTSGGKKISEEAFAYVNKLPNNIRLPLMDKAVNEITSTASYNPESMDNTIKLNSSAKGPVAEMAKDRVSLVNKTLDVDYASSFIQLAKENSLVGNIFRDVFDGDAKDADEALIATTMKELDTESLSQGKPPVFSVLVRGFKEARSGLFGGGKTLSVGKGIFNNGQHNYDNLTREKTVDGKPIGNYLTKGSISKVYGTNAAVRQYQSSIKQLSDEEMAKLDANKYSIARSLELYMNDTDRLYNSGHGPRFKHHSTDTIQLSLNNMNTGEPEIVRLPINKALQMLTLLTSETTQK